MPKVSEQHLEARKQQIVDAAFRCFARKGFHPTTMHEICAEAELSAGAVYRYFGSKVDIIASACDVSQNATDLGLLGEALDVPDTREMLRGLTHAFFGRLDGEAAAVSNKALVQFWAEVAVNADIRASRDVRMAEIRAGLGRVVEVAQRRGDFSTALDADAVVILMFSMYDGYRLQKAIDPTLDTEQYRAVIEALLTGAFWTGGLPATAGTDD
jgi:AcrR family transcriptional regulator